MDSIQIQHSASGANLYALIRNADGDVWDDVGSAFVPYATVDLDDYDLPMTEQGTASRYYAAAVPGFLDGLYSVVAFVRAGGSPAETDTAIGAGEIDWDGNTFRLHAKETTVVNNGQEISMAQNVMRLIARSDPEIANDLSIALNFINTDEGSGVGTYDNTTDSVEAIAASGGGGLDAAGVRAAVGLASANLDTQLNALPTNAELATALGTADDAVLAAIGAAGAGLTAIPWNASWDAEVQSEVADALEATIADSIPADGTIPSVKQALYMLVQFMVERNVTGTTATVRKADGTTSLYTLTLNSATAPTSVTRAT